MLSPRQWHERFAQQARWTARLREYVFERLGLRGARRVLEVGCGTGAVLADLERLTRAQRFGIDIDRARLAEAEKNDPDTLLSAADGLRLPFAEGTFDAVVCHFYLLWTADAARAAAEMARVTRPGGWVAALAEPDYGGRIDHPAPLAALGRQQARALAAQGADPLAGRKLAGWLVGAGLRGVQAGVLGGEWNAPPDAAARESEWAVLEDDLRGRISAEELRALREVDAAAWAAGERILYVPTFYAFGQVKGEEERRNHE